MSKVFCKYKSPYFIFFKTLLKIDSLFADFANIYSLQLIIKTNLIMISGPHLVCSSALSKIQDFQ